MEVRIKASKTDPLGDGGSVFVWATGDVCLVVTILSYMILWGQETSPFFKFGCIALAGFCVAS